MADIEVQKKDKAARGGGIGGMDPRIWMVIALVAVGGLMAWLYYETDRIERTAVVAEAPAEDDEADAATYEQAEIGALATDAQPFEGRRVALSNVSVAALLGERAFWADAPGMNPFLMAVGPDLSTPVRLEQGARYDVRGLIALVDQAVLDEWVASGVISEDRRAEAEFATHYLLAERMRPVQ
jgi:hypothetical protein